MRSTYTQKYSTIRIAAINLKVNLRWQRLSGLACLVLLLCVYGTLTHASGRLAFVVGNANYKELNPLLNPHNDAEDIAARLQALGFDLYAERVHKDLSERSLQRAFNGFVEQALGKEIALVYYAGHGMQFNGRPHLLPVDAPDAELSIVMNDSISLDWMLGRLDGAAKLTVAIFDACREIPNLENAIAREARRGGAVQFRGLSRPSRGSAPRVIAFSGAFGELVADGSGRNSPYTSVLLEHLDAERIRRSGWDVSDLFEEVAYQVGTRAQGQRPEVINQRVRPNQFYFSEPGNHNSNTQNATTRIETARLSARPELFKSDGDAERQFSNAEQRAKLVIQEEERRQFEEQRLVTLREKQKIEEASLSLSRAVKISIQAYLNSQGIHVGSEDGQWGKLTREGLRVWQVREGYDPTGYMTKMQYSSLKISLLDVGERQPFEPEMIRIPGGSFQMGSNEVLDKEKPVHTVNVTAFEMGKYEVTFDEYDTYARAIDVVPPDDEGWGRGKRPVINVSYWDAISYVNWLSEQTGKTYRLPSESEWEYAARAGTTGRYSHHGTLCEYGNGREHVVPCRDGYEKTAPVGSYKPNRFGLFDVHGNVWEWVEDCWFENYQGAPDDGTARSSNCRRSVYRGGGWDSSPRFLRVTSRDAVGRHDHKYNLGFRVARTLDR